MRNRLPRLVAVVVAVLGLMASAAPPASATVVTTGVFVGVWTWGNGIAYPCVTGKGPSPPTPPQFDASKCPPTTNNTAAWTFDGTAVTGVAKVVKAKCLLTDLACAHVALTTMRGMGTIKGNCSAYTKTGTVTWSSTDIVNTKESSPSLAGTISVTAVGGVNVMTGTVQRSSTATIGTLTGSFFAVPDASTGSGCWDKRGKRWVSAGAYAIVWPNF